MACKPRAARLTAVVFTASLALSGVASAETRIAAAAGERPPDTDIDKKNGALSDKLNSTNGVIHPQGDVDPGMQKQAPATGSMPVLPPPGSPGGSPEVQPK